MVDTRMRRLGFSPDGLIEVLHTAQEAFGYLEPEALDYIGASLGVPPSRVYGVATFYSHFTLKPKGRHTCVVCTGTACHLKGGSRLVDILEKELGAGPGQTTEDLRFTVETVNCLGACALAPVIVMDDTYYADMDSRKMKNLIKRVAGPQGAAK